VVTTIVEWIANVFRSARANFTGCHFVTTRSRIIGIPFLDLVIAATE
jgi:hypothetical protein